MAKRKSTKKPAKRKSTKKSTKKRKPKSTKKAIGISIVIKGAKGNDLRTGLDVISALRPAIEELANVTRESAWSIQAKFKRKLDPASVIPRLAMHARPFDVNPPLKLSIGVQLSDKSFAPLAWQDSRNLAEALIEFQVNGTKLELRYSNGKRV